MEYSKTTPFYTYLYLRRDGTPYYVGKGKGRRVVQRHHVAIPEPSHIFIQYWANESDALEIEKWYIALFGRKDNGTGILRNLTDGGETTNWESMTPEAQERRVAGLKRWSHTEEAKHHIATLHSIGGRASGRKNILSGHIARLNAELNKRPEHQSHAGRFGGHARWHTNRGIVKEGCLLCQ